MINNLGGLSDVRGRIKIAAIDHRGSLKESLHPEDPDKTTDEEIVAWKKRLIELYKDYVSGILIDPIYGVKLLDKSAPCKWMMSMEKTGYRGGKEARVTELLPNWSVAQAKAVGAVAVKLLLYFDPENVELAAKQKETALRLSEECQKEGVIFLLEPLSYLVEGSREKEVLKIAETLQEIPVDIWKFEYPGTFEACKQITEMMGKPWVLLSAGMKYEQYKEALKMAMRAGASGFAVGRAVWQEFGEYKDQAREKYFMEVALPRMKELSEIVDHA